MSALAYSKIEDPGEFTLGSGRVLAMHELPSTLIGWPPPLRNEFYGAIPVDQFKSVWYIRECLRRCRQGLVNRAVTTFGLRPREGASGWPFGAFVSVECPMYTTIAPLV